MVLTQAQIDICNLALGLLDETEINVTDTTDKAYVLCNRYYSLSLEELLQRHYWSEAKKRIAIGQTGIPLFGYSYEFALPSDFVRFYRIDNSGNGSTEQNYSECPYEIEGVNLLTSEGYSPEDFAGTGVAGSYYTYDGKAWLCKANSTDNPVEGASWEIVSNYGILLNIIYIRSLEPTTFSPLLTTCVAHNLAIKVAAGLTRGLEVVDALTNSMEKMLLREAKTIDSMNKYPVQRFNSYWINGRR